MSWIRVNDIVSGENWFNSGYVSKLQPIGIPGELDMGYKNKKTQMTAKV